MTLSHVHVSDRFCRNALLWVVNFNELLFVVNDKQYCLRSHNPNSITIGECSMWSPIKDGRGCILTSITLYQCHNFSTILHAPPLSLAPSPPPLNN